MNVSANNNTFPSAAPDTATNQTAAPGAAINQSILTLTGQHSKHKQYSQHINFNIFSRTFSRLALSLLLALVANNASAQSYDDYDTSYDSNTTNTSSVSIQHRAPIWYNYNAYGGGGVDGGMVTVGSTGQQVAHEYEETIYMHKGQTVQLNLPCASVADDGTYSDWDYKDYYRWYNYNTDGNFYTTNNVPIQYTIHLYTSSDDGTNRWSGARIYVWNDDGGTTEILGSYSNCPSMTKENDYTYTYSFLSDVPPLKVIFYNAAGDSYGKSSSNLDFYNNGYYNRDSHVSGTGTLVTSNTELHEMIKGGEYDMYGVDYKDSGRYKFSNGYVGGMATPDCTPFGIAFFGYPSSDTNTSYDVACDYSNYDDFNASTSYTAQEDITSTAFTDMNFASGTANNWTEGSGGTKSVAYCSDTEMNGYTSSTYCYKFTNTNWGDSENDLIYNTATNLPAGTYFATALIYVNDATNNAKELELIAEDKNGNLLATRVLYRNGSNDYPYTAYMEFTVPSAIDVRIGIRTTGSYFEGKLYFLATDFTVTRLGDYFGGYSGEGSTFREPTLIGRAIYHIIDVDNTTDDYTTAISKANTGNKDENYVEEYNITFPARHTAYSPETVGLAMDARAYAIPNLSEDDMANKTLTVTMETTHPSNPKHSTDFNVYTSSLQNCQRAISFGLGDLSDATRQWETDDGTEADIYVKEGEYKVAHFHLTFKEESVPLTDKQVAELNSIYCDVGGKAKTEDEIREYLKGYEYQDAWWVDLATRAPNYLESADKFAKVGGLSLDSYFTEASHDAFSLSDNITPHFSAFPMTWGYTGYGFNNGTMGARSGNFHDAILYPDNEHVNAGQYAIMNDYYGWDDVSGDVPTNYASSISNFMYIDGTQTPGEICTLPIEGSFCKGTKLYVTAWMKGANTYNDNATNADFYVRDDSSIIMTILGDGENGTDEVASFSSGQIRLMDDDGGSFGGTDYGPYVKPYSDDGGSGDWGKGSENQWWQVAFSFTIDKDYDSYSLALKNYSASSNGADFYFADLRIYVCHPDYTAAQVYETSGTHAGLFRADFDYDALMVAEGGNDETHTLTDNEGAEVDFVIINENTYRDELIGEIGTYDVEDYDTNASGAKTEEELEEIVKTAIKNSRVTITGANNYSAYYHTAAFYYYWDHNTAYNNASAQIYSGANLIKTNTTDQTLNGSTVTDAVWLYHRNEADGTKMLSVDFMSTEIKPYVPYRMIVVNHVTTGTDDLEAAFVEAMMESKCAMSKEFFFSSTTELRMNGECFDPTYTYCEGQINNFSIHQTYVEYDEESETFENTASDGSVTYSDVNVYKVKTRDEWLSHSYCDWYYGSEASFKSDVMTLLNTFRAAYPYATDFTEAIKAGEESTYNSLISLVNAGTLVLFKESLNVYADAASGTDDVGTVKLVIQPVIYENELTGNWTNSSYIPYPYLYSYAYIAIELRTDKADAGYTTPELRPGFADQTYPSYKNLMPAVRAGVSQLTSGNSITVNTRDGKLTEGTLSTIGDPYGATLYLVATDDPLYHNTDLLDAENFTTLTYPAGTVSNFSATASTTTRSLSKMDITFNKAKFAPREGYTYDFAIFFGKQGESYTWIDRVNETEDEKESDVLSCPGLMQLEVKVVPEYLVWQGDMRDNWNRDGAWKRATTDDLNGRTVEAYDPLNPMKNGFVPMLFSKAVIPNDFTNADNAKHSRAEIYNAGFEESSGMYTWHGNFDDNDTYTYGTAGQIIIDPTLNIMYDLPVYDSGTDTPSLGTETFRVNLCDQVHLESDAQLLHSELLMCDTVWTDIKIPSDEWHLVSTPLKATYAGDWYTGANGKEVAPYFTGLGFDDDTYNSYNRFAPLVYQRSWGKENSQIVFSNDGTNNITALPAYATTGWTSVYNDVTTSYQPGEGFAIKSYFSKNVSDNNSITFRFPKYDTNYDYYEYGETPSVAYSEGTTLTKNDEGVLFISGLVTRTKSSAANDYLDSSVYTNTTGLSTSISSDNGYYIVGNPFTAPMSLYQFGLDNSGSYWYDCANGPLYNTAKDVSGNIIGGSITKDGDLTSLGTGSSDEFIAPYGAFFFQPEETSLAKGTRATSLESFTFKKDMQAWSSTASDNGSSGNEQAGDNTSKLVAFSIRAKSGQGASSAAFAYFDDATDEYDASEDAVLLSDITWHSDSIPMVYTVAGDMAASVNRLHSLNVVPIGVFVADSCAYTLTFVGTYNLASPVLYDALNDTETEITEGMTLSLKGASHGRYFIKTTGIEEHGIEEAASEYSITAYSPADRTIVVSSNAEIESVEIYSIGGTLEKKVSVGGGIACTVDGVDSGIAVVRARTSEGTLTRKIIVR